MNQRALIAWLLLFLFVTASVQGARALQTWQWVRGLTASLIS